MNEKPTGRARNLLSVGFGYLVNTAQELSLPLLFPAIKQSIGGLTNAHLAVIDGVRVIVQTLLSPLWGMASDFGSRKLTLVIGTGMWGTLVILCGFAQEVWHLLVAWVIACLGIGALVPAGFSMLADLYPPRERGKAIGMLNAIGMSGIIVAALGFGAIIGLAEGGEGSAPALSLDAAWRIGFFGVGGLSLLAALVMAVFVREPPRGSAEPEMDEFLAELAASQFRFRVQDIKVILKTRTVLLSFVMGFFVLTSLFLLYKFFATWMVEDMGFRQSSADMAFGAVILGLVAGTLLGGVLADRAERRWPNRGRVLVAQFAILMVIPLMALLVTSVESLGAIVALAGGVAFFIEWPRRAALQPMIQNVMPPELRGTALALAEFFQGGLASILLIFLAVFSDRFSLSQAMLYGGCGCLALGLLAGFALYPVYGPDLARLRAQMAGRREQVEKDG